MGLNIINLAHRLLKNILKIVHEVFKETINFRRELENRKMKQLKIKKLKLKTLWIRGLAIYCYVTNHPKI